MIKMSFITNWISINFLFENTGGIDFHIEKLGIRKYLKENVSHIFVS